MHIIYIKMCNNLNNIIIINNPNNIKVMMTGAGISFTMPYFQSCRIKQKIYFFLLSLNFYYYYKIFSIRKKEDTKYLQKLNAILIKS